MGKVRGRRESWLEGEDFRGGSVRGRRSERAGYQWEEESAGRGRRTEGEGMEWGRGSDREWVWGEGRRGRGLGGGSWWRKQELSQQWRV